MIHTRLYRDGKLAESDFDVTLISDHLEEPDTMVWLDLEDPDLQDFGLLPEEFGLHGLAVEDATKPSQRPKLEIYEDHLFVVMYALSNHSDELTQSEIDVFVGKRFMITVRKSPVWNMKPAIDRWDAEENLSEEGIGFFLYALMDVVVDEYMSLAEKLNDELEDLQGSLFSGQPKRDVQRNIFNMRRKLVAFNRYAIPFREVLNSLLRRDRKEFSDEMRLYFQDVYDHLIRVGSSVETMREILSSAYEVHLSLTSNHLNEIMKKVTSWAALLGVATVIAGVYGMNFKLVPRDATLGGFWFAIGLMAVASLALYAMFKRKDWL